jgi:hypothetical protein
VVAGRMVEMGREVNIGIWGGLDRMTVSDCFVFDETTMSPVGGPTADWFERDPLVCNFGIPETEVPTLGFIGIHVKPEDAVKEIDRLYDVYQALRARTNSPPGYLLAGDLNAGCTYVRNSDWRNIRLRNSSDFVWLIGDSADTTSGNTTCAYDRFVISQRVVNVTANAQVVNLASVYGWALSDVIRLSDHFPIEVDVGSLMSDAAGPSYTRILSVLILSSIALLALFHV